MRRKILTAFLTITFAFFVASCSSDDDNPVNPNEKPTPEQPDIQPVQLPQAVANSSDPHAAQLSGMIAMVNGFGAYASYFTPPQGAKTLPKTTEDGSWDYVWNDGSLVITLHYEENAEGYAWKVTLNGTDANDGTVYNDWVMMNAYETADGSNGNLSVYEENSTDLAFSVSWSKNTDGSTYLEFTTYGEYGMKIEVTVNEDQSGSLVMYEYKNGEYVKTMKITWTSTGGEWWEYDSQGNVSNHGSF